MKLFSIEITVCATAYIKAETIQEARAKALALKGDFLEVTEDETFNSRSYDRVEDEITYSPAMTILDANIKTAEWVHDYATGEDS